MEDGAINPDAAREVAKAGTLDGELVDHALIESLRAAHRGKLDSARQIAEAMGLFDLLGD
jgi:hypothetical protein